MGKGDRRSKRGKIWLGTSGKTRPKTTKCCTCKKDATTEKASPKATKKASSKKAKEPKAAE